MDDRLSELEKEMAEHRVMADMLAKELNEHKVLLTQIQNELSRYKGFVGGIVWVIGAMLVALKGVWPVIRDWFGGK